MASHEDCSYETPIDNTYESSIDKPLSMIDYTYLVQEKNDQSSVRPNFSSKGIFNAICCLSVLVTLALGLSIAAVYLSQRGVNATTHISGQSESNTGSGSTYIRWGRRECPETAELVYTGYAGGSHWSDSGGGSNYICLPEKPEFDVVEQGLQDQTSRVDGVEYEIYDFSPFSQQHNHDAPCAVCSVAQRGRMIMIPAKTSCPSGWIREYFGYLMSARSNHNRAEFVCVDRNPDVVGGILADESGSLFFPVEVRCLDNDPNSFTGGLPCDKYPTGNELTCVVCTK